MLDFEGLRH